MIHDDKNIDEDNFQYFRHESTITGNISTTQILNNLQLFDDSGTIKNSVVLFSAREQTQITQLIMNNLDQIIKRQQNRVYACYKIRIYE